MGKRSSFERRERDFYPTPIEAVAPLIPHLDKSGFWEPCAGDGRLATHIEDLGGGICVKATDIEPQVSWVDKHDAMTLNPLRLVPQFVTNPPWPQRGGEPTIGMALYLSDIAPTWFLLSADFAHNLYFQKLAPRCIKIVSVGRVSWEQNGTAGKDNCAWYLFDKDHAGAIEFVPRINIGSRNDLRNLQGNRAD